MTCVCGHDADAHQHFRPGADCGACGRERCPSYRTTSRPRRLLARAADALFGVRLALGLARDHGRTPRP